MAFENQVVKDSYFIFFSGRSDAAHGSEAKRQFYNLKLNTPCEMTDLV